MTVFIKFLWDDYKNTQSKRQIDENPISREWTKLEKAAEEFLTQIREDAKKSDAGRIGYRGFQLLCQDYGESEKNMAVKLMILEASRPGSIEEILYPYCLKASLEEMK